jgi:hypothetical protein
MPFFECEWLTITDVQSIETFLITVQSLSARMENASDFEYDALLSAAHLPEVIWNKADSH